LLIQQQKETPGRDDDSDAADLHFPFIAIVAFLKEQ
jgi:hypothetical protein